MILFTILQIKVSTVLRWGGKQNTLSFTTNLCPICCNFTKNGIITILERCVHGDSLILEHGVYMRTSAVITVPFSL